MTFLASQFCPVCGSYWECEHQRDPEAEPEVTTEMTPEEAEFWIDLNAEALAEKEED